MAFPIGLALAAIVETLKLVNKPASVRLASEISELELEILDERRRGYDSDDSRLEYLYAKLEIKLREVQNVRTIIAAEQAAADAADPKSPA